MVFIAGLRDFYSVLQKSLWLLFAFKKHQCSDKKAIDYNIFKRLWHEGNSNCQCEANTGKQENNRNNLMQTKYGKRTSQKANFTQ